MKYLYWKFSIITNILNNSLILTLEKTNDFIGTVIVKI